MTDSSTQSQRRTLRAMGVTLIGVILSVSTTVAFGLTGPWWFRTGAALATAAGLIAAIKLGTSQGSHGPVTRAADWLTGGDESDAS